MHERHTALLRLPLFLICVGAALLCGGCEHRHDRSTVPPQPSAPVAQDEHDTDAPPPVAVATAENSDFWHAEPVRWLAFTSDSATLFSVAGGSLYQWNVASAKLLKQSELHGFADHYPFALSPDSRALASTNFRDFTLHLWDVEQGQRRLMTDPFLGRLGFLGFSPDSKRLLALEWQEREATIRVLDTATGQELRSWPEGIHGICDFHFVPETTEVLTVDTHLVLRRWDYNTGELLEERAFAKKNYASSAHFSPDATYLAVGAPLHEVGRVFHVETGAELFELAEKFEHRGWSYVLGFLADGHGVMTSHDKSLLTLWHVPSGEIMTTYRAEADEAVLSPDGRWLAIVPKRYKSGRQIEIWDAQSGTQLRTPRLRTYLRPVVARLAPEDPFQIALHWAGPDRRIPIVGRYAGQYSPQETLESLRFRVTTPDGRQAVLSANVSELPKKPNEKRRGTRRGHFAELPSFFLDLHPDGFETLVFPYSGRWQQAGAPEFDQPGVYKISLSGNIVIDPRQPIPFQTGEITIERRRQGAVPLTEIQAVAKAKLKEVLANDGAPAIHNDTGGYGELAPLNLIDTPTHQRVVLLATYRRSEFAGSRIVNHYRVVVEPDGRVTGITHREKRTCVARGTPVETDAGAVPIELLSVGDRVWSYDVQRRHRVLSTVRAIHAGVAPNVLEINEKLQVTAEHPVYADGMWKPAGQLRRGDKILTATTAPAEVARVRVIRRPVKVYDLVLDAPHTFFAGGMLVHNKTMGFNVGHYDRWRIFHLAASPYENPVWGDAAKSR